MLIFIAAVSVFGCSSIKHVPDGEHLLNSIDINITDNKDVSPKSLTNYLRQTPNHKVLGFAKLQLSTYSLSGLDTTKWYNRWLQRLGQPPVIYNDTLTEMSARQLRMALVNAGYLSARVNYEAREHGKKRMDVDYNITTGKPHIIERFNIDVPDTAIAAILDRHHAMATIADGSLFDRNMLDERRSQITQLLHSHGYYRFSKEHISFSADTARNEKGVYLTMHVLPPSTATHSVSHDAQAHEVYYIRKVVFVTDYDPGVSGTPLDFGRQDTTLYNNITVLDAPGKHYLKPSALDEKCFVVPGRPYDSRQIERTYEALQQLSILNYINIVMQPAGTYDGHPALDAFILLSPTKRYGISVELEGTNSEGDLGFGLGVTFQHRNIAQGSQLLTAKLRTSYESLSGNLNGLINERYTEQAGEVSITFPKFEAPFLSKSVKQRMKANTEFSVSVNYQELPENTRIIAGAAWKYKFSRQGSRHSLMRHTFDFIDINYVYLPRSTINFLDSIAPANPLVRYSYEDHLIMRMGYTFYRTNRRMPTGGARLYSQPSVYTLRTSIEVAGNLLYAISSATHQRKHDGAYTLFGTQFAQYIKAEADYTYTLNMSDRTSVSVHGGIGLGYPYGNSRMIPFEKRFYAGGANGVRGWSVRSLGPGSYDARNSVDNFINQCGDISLNASIEYRAKLFWVIESALFIDAGNIWTVH
ncbi:MAG: BamA/TamA family outer membrane protein, partial [Muribaculaceae bacterium]|nr:BamA/TamA family outer membrane protein [Muribaculaceae bacterium]